MRIPPFTKPAFDDRCIRVCIGHESGMHQVRIGYELGMHRGKDQVHPLVAAGFGHYIYIYIYLYIYICLRTGGGSDGNVLNVLRGLRDFWGPCGA